MLTFIPKTDQFICVVNKKIEAPKLLNALGHMTAGLVSQHRDNLVPMRFRDFVDKSQSIHPSTSENAFIVLRAENSNQLRTLRNKLIKDKIPFTDFTHTMKEKSREHTKKFSLYVG